MQATITTDLDPAGIVGRTVQADGQVGRVALLKHIDIDVATGLSRTGFKPGVVLELRTATRGSEETRFVYVPYGATITLH